MTGIGYQHSQRGPWSTLLAALGLGCAVAALLADDFFARVALGVLVVVFVMTAAAFHRITVTGGDEALHVRFGPLPWFGTRIAYGDIATVEAGRSSWIDGFGVHWIPGRGWTFNLWGFECVRVQTARGCVQIGTDDVEGLIAFLRTKIAAGPRRGQPA
ncbi:MAG: hypothetical protein FJ265_13610 [Planctomycetes bacterium]|nr:hypothetical protein [Planctomycetota bacterium]